MSVEKLFPQLEAYYDATRGAYWIPNSQGGWVSVNERSLKLHLKASGVSMQTAKGEVVSELEQRLMSIQTERDVIYAGPLAGFSSGFQNVCGNKILVTSSPKLIEPKEGPLPIISKFLRGVFNDDETDQCAYFIGWLKVAYEALRAGSLRHGQAVALAGPAGSGKSFTQNHLITPILGGRAAKPFRYMSGATDFNAELFHAEHLLIEDETSNTTIAGRRHFGSRLKDFTVNEEQSCHGKNRQAVMLTPFWRVSLSLNDEPENLMILPVLDDSLKDKLMLLRAYKTEMPMPTGTLAEREAFLKALSAELPAFCHYLLNYSIPEHLRDERFGVKHYHHPELLAGIDALAPETRLLSLIDMALFSGAVPTPRWTGTAEALEEKLQSEPSVAQAARKLLDWTNATGTYLGRLAQKHPERVQKQARENNSRVWIIQAPHQ